MLRAALNMLRVFSRIVAVAFMTVVVIGAVVWAISWYRSEALQQRVSAAHSWDIVSALPERFVVTFKTRCLKHRLLYQLNVRLKSMEPGPTTKKELFPTLSPDVLKLYSNVRTFTIRFEDADGFTLIDFSVPREKWLNTVDDENRHVGMNVDGEEPCDPEMYASVRKVSLSYYRSDK